MAAAETEIGHSLKPGDMFANYKVVNRLGNDANGVTVKAENVDTNTFVSLRALTKEAMKNSEYVKLFESHALKASKLDHPNIIKLLSAGSFEGRMYFTKEFIEGVSFRRLVETKKSIEPDFAIEVGLAVLKALEYTHSRGIFHRHLSPSCILILPDKSIKVSGFGVVPQPIADLEELTNNAGDTPFYIAPEQAATDGKEYSDVRTDIYSLGSILYHALTGTPPFHGSSLEEVLLNISEKDVIPISLVSSEIPEEISEIVQRMLAFNPEERFQSAIDARNALEKAKENTFGSSGKKSFTTANIANSSRTTARRKKPTTASKVAKVKTGNVKSSKSTRTSRRSTAPKKVSRAMRHVSSKNNSSNAVVYIIVGIIFLAIFGAIIYFWTKSKENNSRNFSTNSRGQNSNAVQNNVRKTSAEKWYRAPSLSQGNTFPRKVVMKNNYQASVEKEEEITDNYSYEPEVKNTPAYDPKPQEPEELDPEEQKRRKAIMSVLNE